MAEITAQTKDGHSVTFEYDLPETLDAAIDKYGKEIVESFALRSLTIAIQGHARGLIKSGKTKVEIVEAMAAWQPGVPRVVKSPEEKFRALWDKMSPEDRAKIQKELKAHKAA